MTFSLAFKRPEPVAWFGGVSLLVGSVLCDSLRSVGVADALVKWPNDVLVHDAKLAGILVESRTTNAMAETLLVLGMGVNYQRGEEACLIDQASTDLAAQCDPETLPDRSALIADIATRLVAVVSEDIPQAVNRLAGRWADYDALAGVSVVAVVGKERIYGTARGIDGEGSLQIETIDGIRALNSADVTVRRDI